VIRPSSASLLTCADENGPCSFVPTLTYHSCAIVNHLTCRAFCRRVQHMAEIVLRPNCPDFGPRRTLIRNAGCERQCVCGFTTRFSLSAHFDLTKRSHIRTVPSQSVNRLVRFAVSPAETLVATMCGRAATEATDRLFGFASSAATQPRVQDRRGAYRSQQMEDRQARWAFRRFGSGKCGRRRPASTRQVLVGRVRQSELRWGASRARNACGQLGIARSFGARSVGRVLRLSPHHFLPDAV